jgi:hypothetical protein
MDCDSQPQPQISAAFPRLEEFYPARHAKQSSAPAIVALHSRCDLHTRSLSWICQRPRFSRYDPGAVTTLAANNHNTTLAQTSYRPRPNSVTPPYAS